MKNKPRILLALISASAMVVAGAASAISAPMARLQVQSAGLVDQVQYRRHHDHDHDRRGYYHGYRGSRHHRHGYRRGHDGWWYPLAAFGAGAIIGGAMANGARTHGRVESRHVQWCLDHYRTYRPSDNSYVPRIGVRAQCHSPYGG